MQVLRASTLQFVQFRGREKKNCPKGKKRGLLVLLKTAAFQMASPADPPSDRTTQFLELLNAHDRGLSVYVYGLVPRDSEAEDILQQTKMILWKHFDDFELGTHFLAWARKIAFHQVLTHRRKKKREHLPLEEEVLDAVSAAVSHLEEEGTARHQALRDCVARLPSEHRHLIELRYFREKGIEEIANEIHRTEGAVYRALSRIRLALMECVQRRKEVLS
jgi:RNA polymerase sigma-70 factor, ECF subfamily